MIENSVVSNDNSPAAALLHTSRTHKSKFAITCCFDYRMGGEMVIIAPESNAMSSN